LIRLRMIRAPGGFLLSALLPCLASAF
jgi:hypothetical protein